MVLKKMHDLTDLYKEFNIKPNNELLYDLAFTHSSFNADNKTHHHDYERLEFLGDSIVGLVVATLAFNERKELNQGDLTKLRSNLVKTSSLANYARQYSLLKFVQFGNSYVENNRNQDGLLEDVFEAFMGAVYLDKGFNFAFNLIKKIFNKDIISFSKKEITDYKSKLQEAMQAEHRKSVYYKLVSSNGPAHEKTFNIAVYFDNQLLAVGEGKSKKEAEQAAAKAALRKAAIK